MPIPTRGHWPAQPDLLGPAKTLGYCLDELIGFKGSPLGGSDDELECTGLVPHEQGEEERKPCERPATASRSRGALWGEGGEGCGDVGHAYHG